MIPFNRIMNSAPGRRRGLLNRAQNAGHPIGRMLAAYGQQGGPESQSTMSATPLATEQTPISSEPVGGTQNAGLYQRIARARRAARMAGGPASMSGMNPEDTATKEPSSDKAMSEEAQMLSKKRGAQAAPEVPAIPAEPEPAELNLPPAEPEAPDKPDDEEMGPQGRYAKRIKMARQGAY